MIAERRRGRRWVTADSDLGLAMLWTVDPEGRYRVRWEVPLSAPRGLYRLRVAAKRYRLASRPFGVGPSTALRLERASARAGRVAVRLAYPAAVRDVDLTYRPGFARGGAVRFRVGGRSVLVRSRRGSVFSVRAPAGRTVTVAPGRARDRFGNVAGAGLRLR